MNVSIKQVAELDDKRRDNVFTYWGYELKNVTSIAFKTLVDEDGSTKTYVTLWVDYIESYEFSIDELIEFKIIEDRK